jgi:hypothetical protein
LGEEVERGLQRAHLPAAHTYRIALINRSRGSLKRPRLSLTNFNLSKDRGGQPSCSAVGYLERVSSNDQ